MNGTQLFSGFEVIQAAMEVEKNGHRFYSTMAQRAVDPLVKDLFSWLAQDEVEHLNRLKKLGEKYQDGFFMGNEEEFLPYLQRFNDSEIFPTKERLDAVLQGEEPDLRTLDLAIEAEEKFAAYFHKAASLAQTEDGQDAFSWLAGEEDRHADILRQRRDQLEGSR